MISMLILAAESTTNIVQLISTLGFPIVCCLGLGWYVKYVTDKEREERLTMQKEHRDEIAQVTTALNNNTLALQKLCDKLGD